MNLGCNSYFVFVPPPSHRILRPGNPIPADIKPFANKHPEMTAKVCALVEFERTEFALKAVKELTCKDEEVEEEKRMVVMELTAPPAKAGKAKEEAKAKRQQLFKSEAGTASGPQRRSSYAGFGVPAQMPPHHHQQQQQPELGPRRRISLYHNMKFHPLAEQEAAKKLNPNAPTFQASSPPTSAASHPPPPQRRFSRPPHFHLHPAQAAAMEAAAAANANLAMMGVAPPPPMPVAQPAWMARRMSAGVHGAPSAFELAASGLTLPPNVVRMPRGPDKGKGFQRWCKSRMGGADAADKNNNYQKKSHAVPIVAPPKEEDEHKEEEKEAEKKEEEKEEAAAAVAIAAPEAQGAAAAAPAPAVPAVVVEGAAAVTPADSSADSGNEEDESFSDQEPAAEVNERAR